MMLGRRLQKYLRSQPLGHGWRISGGGQGLFDLVVVIPALAERANLPKTLATLATNPAQLLERTLVVVVVNQREDTPAALKQDNADTLSWLATTPFPHLSLAVVDATATGLEFSCKDGVGLARKIGFDLCLPLLAWDRRPILVSLDADTLVDDCYLSAIEQHFQVVSQGGAVIPFRHQPGPDAETESAIRSYELYLRSYLFGLTQAGSPYAYHTIGSAFCCRAEAYIAAGGMNRRLAGEDFYFLQRLAKTTGVIPLVGTVVAPAARLSDRVPFGTGPTLKQHVEGQLVNYHFSGAAQFALLRDLLVLMNHHADAPAAQILGLAKQRSEMLADFLDQLGFARVWEKLQKNHSSTSQRQDAFHTWFDALRTRQLLTRCSGHDPCDAVTIVGELLKWGGERAPDTREGQLQVLEAIQGVPSLAGGISDFKFQI